MKKRLTCIFALILAMALLTGCGAGELVRDFKNAFSGDERGGVQAGEELSFDSIVYTRPDLEGLRTAVSDTKDAIAEGCNLRELTRILDRCYEIYYDYTTMYNLADIRTCQDMTDSYYAAEYNWCEENYSVMRQLMEDMLYACAACDLAEDLEESYFWPGFVYDYADAGEAWYSDEIVAMMQQESSLLAQYRELSSSPTIQGDGMEVDYFSYISDLYDEEYRDAMLQYYRKYNEEYARIYIELVKVRSELAQRLGFDNYEEMQYYYYFERDYGPEEAEGYIADIKKYMVPFYKEVQSMDLYSGIYYDALSDKQLNRIVRSAAAKIGGEVEEAYEFMANYGFFDIKLSQNKAAISFQTYLINYDAPFLFLNPYGDTEDILSLSHEFGHYVDAYVNYNAYETIDVSECFSQAMEYLMLTYFDNVMSEEELDNLYRMKMLDTLELYVQQASFAEFESIVYSTDPDKLSAEFLNNLSLQLAIDYGYYDGESKDYYAMSWADIVHFFELPCYIITYPVSNDIAMQIYELEQQEAGLGIEKYLEILPREYEGFIDTVTAGGLQSPFEDGRIESVVNDLRQRLTWA